MKKTVLSVLGLALFLGGAVWVSQSVSAGGYCSGAGNMGTFFCPGGSEKNWRCINMTGGHCAGLAISDCNSVEVMSSSSNGCGDYGWCAGSEDVRVVFGIVRGRDKKLYQRVRHLGRDMQYPVLLCTGLGE